MGFQIIKESAHSKARLGKLTTRNGVVNTPAFIPDATYGVVKHLSANDLAQAGLQIILGNTYHLSIRPGHEQIRELGGLHSFMNWPKPILTDSGGWQAFSLVYRNKMGKVITQGVQFRDHINGTMHLLTPQTVIDIQLSLDSDILMVLDYPIAPDAPLKDNLFSVERTTEWARISKECFLQSHLSEGRILYAIIQGANDLNQRERSYAELSAIGFEGYGFGGPPENDEVVEFTAGLIPVNQLRYMMGAGTPDDIQRYVAMGYDLFDCVIPTRNARHGLLYTSQGALKIKHQQYRGDTNPVDPRCSCELCRDYSRAYLHHLFRIKEPLAARLATFHNLTFYTNLMRKIRDGIQAE